jgi:hypothetical protein
MGSPEKWLSSYSVFGMPLASFETWLVIGIMKILKWDGSSLEIMERERLRSNFRRPGKQREQTMKLFGEARFFVQMTAMKAFFQIKKQEKV